MYIEKEDQCNILEKELKDGLEVGDVIKGIFQSQSEIDANITFPGTSVGDSILTDVNDDGILNENDKTYGNYILIQDNSENPSIFPREIKMLLCCSTLRQRGLQNLHPSGQEFLCRML